MASTATTRNRLNKQGSGDNTGSWGTVLNAQALDLVDEAMDGVTALAVTGNVTLSSINYASDQSRRRVLKLTGTPSASYTITIPSVEKVYLVHNATNATQVVRAGGVGASVPAAVLTTVYCDGTDCFAPSQALATVVGALIDFAGAAAPSGWLLCNGQEVSRTTYSALFSVIGGQFGAGNGSTTFNVPDLRGRVTAGLDAMGSTQADRLTATYLAGRNTLGGAGGLDSVTLTTSQIPAHAHGVTDPGHVHGVTDPGHIHGGGAASVGSQAQGGFGSSYPNVANTSSAVTGLTVDAHVTGISIDNAGGGQGHSNLPPMMVMNKIIYAGA